MIQVLENFVDPQPFLQAQIEYVQLEPDHPWHNRTAQLPIDPGADLLAAIHRAINEQTDHTVWADTINYAAWRQGDQQAPHADSENPDGSPHPYPWRQVGCVLYLNSDYSGGEVYFPQHDITLKPEPGTLVWFPGTTEYMHGVRPITEGFRLTIASFWGQQPPHRHWLYDHTDL